MPTGTPALLKIKHNLREKYPEYSDQLIEKIAVSMWRNRQQQGMRAAGLLQRAYKRKPVQPRAYKED